MRYRQPQRRLLTLVTCSMLGVASMTPAAAQVRIFDIQGSAHLSPLARQAVERVPGIVTAVDDNGFYFQDPEGDGNRRTSDGLFVFTGSAPGVSVGDRVRVSGRVSEFRPGPDDGDNLTTTEIVLPTVTADDGVFPGARVSPTIVGIGGRTPPRVQIDNDTQGSVEDPSQTVYDPRQDGIDFYESLEGMRLRINDATVVGPTNRFGEIWVLGDNGAAATGVNARGGISLRNLSEGVDFNPERIQIDDTLLADRSPAVDVGARFDSITGVLGYGFGNFELLPSELPSPRASDLAPARSRLRGRGTHLSIATYNVLNLDPNDGDGSADIANGQFAGIADDIAHALNGPAIVALQEIQDNNGSVNNGVVDASETFQTLLEAIADADGPEYRFLEIPPVDGANGGQPGGNIRVAYLYDPDVVTLVSGQQGDAATATRIVNENGEAGLSLNPGLVQPDDAAFDDSRKPLAAAFEFRRHRLILINNHFASKGGSEPLYGRRQPPVNGGEDQRTAQARVVNNFVDEALAVDPQAEVIVLGDFNEFGFLPPLLNLTGEAQGTPILTDLLSGLRPEARYTFIFEGNSQALDHMYVSDRLVNQSEVDITHVNAEFNAPDSDHDPILATFRLPPGQATAFGRRGKRPGRGNGPRR